MGRFLRALAARREQALAKLEILDLARGVLADPASRARYDEAVGIVRRGEGLARPDGFPSEPGLVRGADFVTGVAEA